MQIVENKLDVDLFYTLYTSVGWKAPSKQQMETALKNTLTTFVVYDENERPIGMARLLGDCAITFYIKDFLVIPQLQKQGVGRFLLEHIQQHIRNQLQEGWTVSLELISASEKEGFYEQLGFEKRPSEAEGAGMVKFIHK